jgi:hypothetical protein
MLKFAALVVMVVAANATPIVQTAPQNTPYLQTFVEINLDHTNGSLSMRWFLYGIDFPYDLNIHDSALIDFGQAGTAYYQTSGSEEPGNWADLLGTPIEVSHSFGPCGLPFSTMFPIQSVYTSDGKIQINASVSGSLGTPPPERIMPYGGSKYGVFEADFIRFIPEVANPEPSTTALFVIGLLALPLYRGEFYSAACIVIMDPIERRPADSS